MESVIEWLMEGDPVIRWQTLRDLTDASEDKWQAERQRTVETGWGARFRECLRPEGDWPPGRWTDTVWTLLTLMDCGIPPGYPPIQDAARQFLQKNLTPERAVEENWLLTRIDLCHVGFWLRIGAYFLDNDPRLAPVANTLLRKRWANRPTMGMAVVSDFAPPPTA